MAMIVVLVFSVLSIGLYQLFGTNAVEVVYAELCVTAVQFHGQRARHRGFSGANFRIGELEAPARAGDRNVEWLTGELVDLRTGGGGLGLAQGQVAHRGGRSEPDAADDQPAASLFDHSRVSGQ